MTKKDLLLELCSVLENRLNERLDGTGIHKVNLFSGTKQTSYHVPPVAFKSPKTFSWFVEIWVDEICVFREHGFPAEGTEERLINKVLENVFVYGAWTSYKFLEDLNQKEMIGYSKEQQIGRNSNENTYLCSDGNRVTQDYINKKLKQARQRKGKKEGCAAFGDKYSLDLHGPIDNDHTISVDRCKEIGKTELIWALENMEHSSRVAHMAWESYKSGDFSFHLNVIKRMQYVKLHDPETFEKRIQCMRNQNTINLLQ